MSTATLKNQQKPKDQNDLPPAQSLRDATNTGNSLEGYAAMNDVPRTSEVAEQVLEHPVDHHSEISRLAYDFYLERGGNHGAHEDDWYRAEREYYSRRQPK